MLSQVYKLVCLSDLMTYLNTQSSVDLDISLDDNDDLMNAFCV